MLYKYNGILFSLRKEWNSEICYNMDEIWKHYDKRYKPDIKRQIFYDSTIYMKYTE